jgi:predicted enzyme related to lactoylglutathione lyase
MEYWFVITGPDDTPGINGGLSARQAPESRVVNTVEIQDLDGTLTRVTDAGGQVVVPRSPIPGVGWFAQFADPEGNLFGLMQPDADAA